MAVVKRKWQTCSCKGRTTAKGRTNAEGRCCLASAAIQKNVLCTVRC